MANKHTRQVSIFIEAKGAENSFKSLNNEARKLSNELALMDRNTKEYEDTLKKLQTVKGHLDEHRKDLAGINKGWSLAKSGLGDFVGVAAGAFAVDSLLGYGQQLFGVGVQMDALEKKAKTVFGETLPLVTAEAEKNARAMGLTTSQYINAAAAIQDILVPMGFQRKEAADISAQLVNLSGALSEWTGGQISATQVSDILSSALTGEREQLKSLGIILQQSDIDARLAEKGLDKLTGTMKQQAEAAATLELILEKSTDAQSGFANGADSAVRRQAELIAKTQELVEKLSRLLMPVFNGLVTVANGVADALGYVFSAVEDNTQAAASLADQTKKTQAAFNAEIEVLTEGNFSQAERAKLIREINSRYSEYLPNLISEKASIDEIREAQEQANKVFAQKIVYVSFQEKIAAATKEAAQAADAAFEAERRKQENIQTLRQTNDERVEKSLGLQIELNQALRDNAIQTVKDAPQQTAKIKQIYSQLAAEIGTTLGELEKQFGNIGKGAADKGTGKGKASKDTEEEADNAIAERLKRIQEISNRLTELTGKEAQKRSEIFKAEQTEQLENYVQSNEAKALVDLNYEQERKDLEERLRVELQDTIEAELEAVQSKYGQLILLAEKYGIDVTELKKKQAKEEKDILEEIRGGDEPGTFGALDDELADKQDKLTKFFQAKIKTAIAAGKDITDIEAEWQDENLALTLGFLERKLALFSTAFQGIAASFTDAFSLFSESESDFVAFQKALAIAQIAIDTATAISGIIAAAASTSITPIDLAIKITAGIGIVLANIAKAKKLLDTPVPVKQKFEGRYLTVTGEDDGRTYNATLIDPPQTGFLPQHPVLFQSKATGAPVLASERGAEYFVSAESLRNPYVANLTRMIDNITVSGRRVPQFVEGGYSTPKSNVPAGAALIPGTADLTAAVQSMERCIAIMAQMISGGITAIIPDGTVLDINQRFDKINKASGRYYK